VIQSEGADQGVLASPEQVLRGLARELTQPLLYIARQAEFSSDEPDNQASSFLTIERAANSALRLIDSYLLSAQSEYGQKQLTLQTIGVGSVLYDVAHELRDNAKAAGYVIEVDVGYAKPIMTDVVALRASLACLGTLLMSAPKESKYKSIRLVAYKRDANSCVAGIFGTDISLNRQDLKRARRLQGASHMALGSLSSGSGVHFALADSLAQAIGAELCFARRRGLAGLGLVLPKSQQLQLVTL
jgi:light-regulated signal transduction histidine kinase (bacteriophytochrome)